MQTDLTARPGKETDKETERQRDEETEIHMEVGHVYVLNNHLGHEALALALSVFTGLSIAGALGDPPPPFESWPEEGEGGAAADNLTWVYDLAFTLALISSPSFSAALRWSVWARWTRWAWRRCGAWEWRRGAR